MYAWGGFVAPSAICSLPARYRFIRSESLYFDAYSIVASEAVSM
jgi:hypothetical protein